VVNAARRMQPLPTRCRCAAGVVHCVCARGARVQGLPACLPACLCPRLCTCIRCLRVRLCVCGRAGVWVCESLCLRCRVGRTSLRASYSLGGCARATRSRCAPTYGAWHRSRSHLRQLAPIPLPLTAAGTGPAPTYGGWHRSRAHLRRLALIPLPLTATHRCPTSEGVSAVRSGREGQAGAGGWRCGWWTRVPMKAGAGGWR
jgi:hypothetical protein